MKNRDLKRKVEDQHLYAHTNTESDMQGKKEAPHNFPTHKEAVTLTNGYSETRTAVWAASQDRQTHCVCVCVCVCVFVCVSEKKRLCPGWKLKHPVSNMTNQSSSTSLKSWQDHTHTHTHTHIHRIQYLHLLLFLINFVCMCGHIHAVLHKAWLSKYKISQQLREKPLIHTLGAIDA